MPPSDLPSLDTHAHIAADVTQPQVSALGNAVVLAMTRSFREGQYALRPGGAASPTLVWGLGVHPGVPGSIASFNAGAFASALDSFAVVGEVGLDRRGNLEAQAHVFSDVLRACQDKPILISVHSTGRTRDVLDLVEANPHPGLILHWFNGSAGEVRRATGLGCYFSVNAAMTDDQLGLIPPERILTETDFPSSTRRTRASKPGDVAQIESRLDALQRTSARDLVWANFSRLVQASGAAERLPESVLRYLG